MKIYQIYVYDRQLKKYSDQEHGIDGYYEFLSIAEKDLVRASSIKHHQFVLSELTDSSCNILAVAKSGKIQHVT